MTEIGDNDETDSGDARFYPPLGRDGCQVGNQPFGCADPRFAAHLPQTHDRGRDCRDPEPGAVQRVQRAEGIAGLETGQVPAGTGDHFTSVRDMFDLVNTVVAGRREREFTPTLAALREVQTEAENDDTPAHIKTRIAETLDTMQMFDDWYAEVARMPRGVQLTLLKLGISCLLARLLRPG